MLTKDTPAHDRNNPHLSSDVMIDNLRAEATYQGEDTLLPLTRCTALHNLDLL